MKDLYECEECELSWEEFGRSIKVAPPDLPCPKCEKSCSTVICTPYLHFKGGGWDTTKREFERYRTKGMDKDTADEFLENAITDTKENLKKAGSAYSRFEPNFEKMVESGRVKPVSDKKAAEKLKKSREITQEAYDKMGVKPGWREE